MSAGRVQSVALRLVSDREDAVQLFKPEEYWSIEASFCVTDSPDPTQATATVPAKLVEVDGQKVSQMSIKTQQHAQELVQRLWKHTPPPEPQLALQLLSQQHVLEVPPPSQQQQSAVWYTVRKVVKRPLKRNPPPPFVTSTLQQEASRRLGFSASRTMQVAQQLYEGANTGEWIVKSAVQGYKCKGMSCKSSHGRLTKHVMEC